MEYNRAMQAALELSMLNLNNTSYSMTSPEPPYGLLDDEVPIDSLKTKSQNITQCVSVPTSEHVAEIVGRQGCRIKALRAKTNTYIKTPVRGEEPVFVITGRPEDVSSAKLEIMTAAEHFTNLRAKRASSTSNDGSNGGLNDGVRVSAMVRVPYRVVGLVVGPRGTTVKRIQQLTNTYIVTPSRDKDPAFEVRGSPENVAKAKAEIESYISLRTSGSGNNADSPDPDGSQFGSESYDMPSFSNPRISESAYSYSPLHEPSVFVQEPNESYLNVPVSAPAIPGTERVFNFTSFHDALTYINPTLPRPNPVHVQASNREMTFMPTKCQPPSPTYSCDSGSSDGFSTTSPKQFVAGFNSCFVCNDEVTAALIPCGHNLFCMGCAIHIAEHTRMCPACGSQVNNALRIRSR